MSGSSSMPMSSTTAGTAPRPSIQRHDPESASAELVRKATSWPMTIISELRLTRRPRMCGGDISEMYMGTTMDTAPMHTPSSVRAAPSSKAEPAMAHHRLPTMKPTAPMSTVARRPIASATRPPVKAPMAAPTRSIAVTVDSCAAVSSKERWMNSRAPEMTPVSYPNRRPPSAAITATAMARPDEAGGCG